MNIHKFNYRKSYTLESGSKLKELEIAYQTWGTLSPDADNVIWVIHALTANSDVFDWWSGLFGEGKLYNTNEHFIVCPNVLGSHYGTTSPLSINPETGSPYYLNFPQFNVRDMAGIHRILADHLGINKINTLIGGSLGGQQAMEWAISEPERIENLVLMATNARHSPWGIAFNESQRLALASDPSFFSNQPDGGQKGLKAARSIALLSYRNYEIYSVSQQELYDEKTDDFKACSYQQYQGEKLVRRFNAYSYWYLSKAMDSHNIARGRASAENALAQIKANCLIIAITSDQLFPPSEQRFLARHIPNASYSEISSLYGHDGFLIETETLARIISGFYQKLELKKLSFIKSPDYE